MHLSNCESKKVSTLMHNKQFNAYLKNLFIPVPTTNYVQSVSLEQNDIKTAQLSCKSGGALLRHKVRKAV